MPTDQPKSSRKKPLENFAKYGAMGFQMGATIFLLTWAGIWIDKHFQLKYPVFTLILALFSVFAAIWMVIKDFMPRK